MITDRVNKWDCECETRAMRMCDRYRASGHVSWVKGTVCYWVEESTD